MISLRNPRQFNLSLPATGSIIVKLMPRVAITITALAASLLLGACGEDPNAPKDTPNSGTVTIAVDETYKPVIEQERIVFDSANPAAHLIIQYKPEAECIKDYLAGKVRLILVTRPLTPEENKYALSKNINPKWDELARDAVAVVLNNSNRDTAFGLAQLRGILSGQYKEPYTVVFDNGASSTVRYIQDSILKGAALGKNVFAANGNDSVVRYVAQNPKSIGIVGLPYVSSDYDPGNTGAFISTVKVAALYNDSVQDYYQPYQAEIARRYYPLSRNLYYIKNEPHQGLGTGFANFLSHERGQLIFYHAHLFPLKLNVVLRPAEVNREAIR